jgi:hypothetical protein
MAIATEHVAPIARRSYVTGSGVSGAAHEAITAIRRHAAFGGDRAALLLVEIIVTVILIVVAVKYFPGWWRHYQESGAAQRRRLHAIRARADEQHNLVAQLVRAVDS